MKHISYKLDEKLYKNRSFEGYFGGRRTGVLDIETTGLDRRRNAFILGGLLDVDQGAFHQIFAENTGEESEALKAFAELLRPLEVVVTYNGRQFDMPFLKERARRNGIDDMPEPYDLDLYQMVRYNSPLKRLLPNLRQVTLENYMGLWQDRSDEISGAESVDLYLDYSRTKAPEKERKILLHNSDDVSQLTRLTKVIDKCDLHSAMNRMGFPVGPVGSGLIVESIKHENNSLVAWGKQTGIPCEYRAYELEGYPAYIAFEADKKTFCIKMPLNCSQGVHAADLRAAGLSEAEFQAYPGSGSGFLITRHDGEVMCRECNHLVRAYIMRVAEML